MKFTPLSTSIRTAMVFLLLAAPAWANELDGIYRENGPLENLQVIFLALSAMIFLLPVKTSERTFRLYTLGASLLCLSFILREVDVEDLQVPQWVILIGSGSGRNLLLGAAWAILAGFTIRSRQAFKNTALLLLRSPTTLLLTAVALLLVTAEAFDKECFPTAHGRAIEEVLEVIAQGVMLLAAISAQFTSRTVKTFLTQSNV